MLRLELEKAVKKRLVLGEVLVRRVISNKFLIVRARLLAVWNY